MSRIAGFIPLAMVVAMTVALPQATAAEADSLSPNMPPLSVRLQQMMIDKEASVAGPNDLAMVDQAVARPAQKTTAYYEPADTEPQAELAAECYACEACDVPACEGLLCGNDCGCSDCGQIGDCGCGDCFAPTCQSWGLTAEAEVLFFRYHRADGIRIGDSVDGEELEFDFDASPRVTLGVMRDDGFGIRGRYWGYEQNAVAIEDPGDGTDMLQVDTWTLDAEFFRVACITRDFTVEYSWGLRYNDFEELMADPGEGDLRSNSFSGFGGLAGMEVRQALSCHWTVFGRARGAILMDDKAVFNRDDFVTRNNVTLLDSTQGMLELAVGVEYVSCLSSGHVFYARGTAEWQNWMNYSSNFFVIDDEEQFGGAGDVGFGGFGAAIGITY